MDRVSPYTQSELEQSGWSFQTDEQPDPTPVAGPTLQLVYDGMQALEMPTFRISGVELTNRHYILFLRKVHTSHVDRSSGKRIRTKRWGWIQPMNTMPYHGNSSSGEDVGYRTRSTLGVQGPYTFKWIRSEFVIKEGESGLYTLSSLSGKNGMCAIENVLFADLIQPFVQATEEDLAAYSGNLTVGSGYSHKFRSLAGNETPFNTWRVKNLGFVLVEDVIGPGMKRLTDVVPFSLSLAIRPSSAVGGAILTATLR